MFKIPSNLAIDDNEYNAILTTVYVQTSKFLQFPIHLHYTDHSIFHSERIISIISMLIDGSSLELNNEEKFILLCATYLHDIGMQTPHYVTNKPELSLEDLEKIRDKHHEYSEKVILESITLKPEDTFYFGLEAKREFVDIIAVVAKNHRKLDLTVLEDGFIAGTPIRVKLLSTLLRLGDCLDLDCRRVLVARLSSLNIPVLSKLFWFRHQFVEGVKIEKQKVKVFFCFPVQYQSEANYIDVIVNLVKKELSNQIDEVYDILDFYNLRLHKNIEFKLRFAHVQWQMPDDLVAYVKTLGISNVVINDKVFDVYPTRDLCIDSILKSIAQRSVQSIVFFGGISTRLCRQSDIEILSSWLMKNKQAQLYLCYENDEAAMLRAQSLNVEALPNDGNPVEPHARFIHKIKDILACPSLYPETVQERVHIIPISKALNTYPIMVDNDLYCNILTAVRSSESTTAKMRDNSVGKKTKIELLSYMLFILSNSHKHDAISELVELINKEKKEIR